MNLPQPTIYKEGAPAIRSTYYKLQNPTPRSLGFRLLLVNGRTQISLGTNLCPKCRGQWVEDLLQKKEVLGWSKLRRLEIGELVTRGVFSLGSDQMLFRQNNRPNNYAEYSAEQY